MSNAKPYLFGTVLGASAMYVALQYHVIHSHDGFQMVPRTPQQSVGLAYADVRNWTPSQWTDRPELARALMAHGSSDLISESVATSLADGVTEENSTLDQLRAFLNKSAQETASGNAADSLTIPVTPRQPLNSGSDDLNPLPFPRDARRVSAADPFRDAQTADNQGNTVATGSVVPNSAPVASTAPGASRFSAADIIEGLRSDASSPVDSFTAAKNSGVSSSTKTPTGSSSATHFTQAMEDRLFGKPSTAPTVTTSTAATTKPATDASQSMFEEVSSQLESRAQAALNRAQSAAAAKSGNVLSDGTASSPGYLRQRIEQSAPNAVKSAIESSGSNPPGNPAQTGTSLLEQFDPFLE